jgi:RecA/RadA recombinase
MNYIRVCKGVQDKGILVPINTNVYKDIDFNKDYYTSAFIYNDKQYATFKANGTIAGIDDTVTDKLYWDFDSEANLDQARLDAVTLCMRLEEEYRVSPSSIALYFSGKKGFQVEVLFAQELFTPSEAKNICLNVGEGLTTLDRQIYNASRILRLPLTKHQGSGLFKIPLNYSGLQEATVDEIKEEAKNSFPLEDLKGLFKPTAVISKELKQLKTTSPKIEEKKLNTVAFDIADVSWGDKPKFLTPEKYLLSLGFFGSGERSHALMILGSTYKSVGFNETQCYHVLKAAAEMQSDRSGSEKFSKTEIYKNIISQIYAPHWKGGVYSVSNDELLRELSLLVPSSSKMLNEPDVHNIEETGELFVQYAKDIDKNTLEFGIPCIDNNMYVQTGRLYGIIGPPGSGKSSLGITIINNTSKMGIHSLFGSYDMSKYDVYQKLIQRHTRFTREKLYEVFKTGTKEQQLELSRIVREEYKNVSFVFKTGQSIGELKNTILDTEKRLGIVIKLVIVDYLELVQSKFSDPTQSSAEVIQGLREIAINMNKAVIVFLQPNKMSSTIDMPILSYNAAKGSSAIAQAVTAMLTIHRPGYSSRTPENDKFLSIDCVKNRAGPLFSADMYWDGLTGSIREMDSAEKLHLREVRKAKEEQQSDEDYVKF